MEAEATTTMLDGWRALERRGTVDSITEHGTVETWHWHSDAYEYRCVWTSAGTPAAEIVLATGARRGRSCVPRPARTGAGLKLCGRGPRTHRSA